MARLLRGTIRQQGLVLDDESLEKMVSLGCTFSAMPWVKIRIQCNGVSFMDMHVGQYIYIYTYIHTYIHTCVCVCMCVYCMYGTLRIQYTCLCFAGVYLICRYVLIYTRFCENIGVWDCMEITKDIKYGLDWIGLVSPYMGDTPHRTS